MGAGNDIGIGACIAHGTRAPVWGGGDADGFGGSRGEFPLVAGWEIVTLVAGFALVSFRIPLLLLLLLMLVVMSRGVGEVTGLQPLLDGGLLSMRDGMAGGAFAGGGRVGGGRFAACSCCARDGLDGGAAVYAPVIVCI